MKKKARVFINMHYLELGGAETALIGLLSAIDYDHVSVDLFLNDHRGELLSYIPQKVHLLPIIPSYSMLERPIVELFRKGYWRIAVARLLAKFDTWRDLHRNILHKDDFCCFFNMAKRTTPLLPFINPETNYDLAISFLAPHQIVADKVLAKRKVAWIHTDYTNVYVRPEKEVAVWRCFDAIASISDEVTTKFVQVFPSLRKEVFVFENILPIDMIGRMPLFQRICFMNPTLYVYYLLVDIATRNVLMRYPSYAKRLCPFYVVKILSGTLLVMEVTSTSFCNA